VPLVLGVTLAIGHGGGVDVYGCHHDYRRGNYHCHTGPLAGQAFASKDDMLRALRELQAKGTSSSPTTPLPTTVINGRISTKQTGINDGDTIRLLINGVDTKVRLYGIDAPEYSQPYGPEATNYLAKLINGKEITIERTATDRYGRTVALVYADDICVNPEMIRAGYAWVYPKYCNISACSQWKEYENQARLHRLGLWATGQAEAPWNYRHQ